MHWDQVPRAIKYRGRKDAKILPSVPNHSKLTALCPQLGLDH